MNSSNLALKCALSFLVNSFGICVSSSSLTISRRTLSSLSSTTSMSNYLSMDRSGFTANSSQIPGLRRRVFPSRYICVSILINVITLLHESPLPWTCGFPSSPRTFTASSRFQSLLPAVTYGRVAQIIAGLQVSVGSS